MEIKSVSIIGLGLIGGSIAKALKNAMPHFTISAFDIEETLTKAISEGTIDEKLHSYRDALKSDLIFLCLPVDSTIKIFEELVQELKPNQILTDVCSVKSVFQEIWESKQRNGFYIGGHPMTGKEKGGYENSDPLLFENCIYIIGESAKEYPVIDEFVKLIHRLGARAAYLNPKVHDIIVASVSHLPQLVSVSLINSAGLKENNINFFDYAAGGFRDMTRIAASDFSIWEPIIRKNNKNIIQAIDNFINDLEQMKKNIANGSFDKIAEKFESARIKRDEVPKSTKGFIHSLVDLYVFVKDEPGVLAKLTTSLFEKGINIKDIELLKVREGSGGTFRISFENEAAAQTAKQILSSAGFKIA
ncbi:MAG: prephenate dehydrogenase [Ignavibacteriales bacterium]|nr:prephenate dehydrogenase [Ignavibacteriales bacterium]